MKKLFFVLAHALISMSGVAQNIPFKIQKSEVFTDEYKKSSLVFTENDGEGGVVIVRILTASLIPFPKAYIIEHYNAQFKLLKKYEFEINKSEIIGVFVKDNKINIIERAYDRKTKMVTYSSNTSAITDFVFKKIKLFSEEVNISMFNSVNNMDLLFEPLVIVSEDRSSFVVIHEVKNKKAEMYKLYVFDSNMTLKFKNDFNREIKDRKYRFENIVIAPDGNIVYLLGKAYVNKDKDKGGTYQYEISKISQEGSGTQVFDTNEHYIGSLKAVALNDKVVCVGFYSDRNDNRFKGICYLELDSNTLAINKSKYSPFTPQFLVDKYGTEKDKELKFLEFKGLFFNPKGEIVFNAEERYVTSSYNSNMNGMGSETYIYHYDDIVSAKLDSQGELIWARNINKRQSTSSYENNFLSYTSNMIGNDTYFFINAPEKIKKISHDRIQFGQTSKNNSNLNIIRINANGDFDYQEILDDTENEVPFMVSTGATSGNSVFLMGRRGQKKQLLKITL